MTETPKRTDIRVQFVPQRWRESGWQVCYPAVTDPLTEQQARVLADAWAASRGDRTRVMKRTTATTITEEPLPNERDQ